MKTNWLIFLFYPALVVAEPFFESHQEGWFWYQDPKQEVKVKPTTQPLGSPIFNPTETVKAFRQKVEDSLNLAILAPTEENLKRYADYYFATIRQGQRFTDAYKVMLLKSPQYDYSLKFPTNHLIQPLYERQQREITERKIQLFTKTHGLFFFLASRCSYCHAFAPILKQFSAKYRTSLIPITLDGGALPEFPNVVRDNGTASAFNVYSLPALFAVNPKNKQVFPLAHGALSLSELEDNILRAVEMSHE